MRGLAYVTSRGPLRGVLQMTEQHDLEGFGGCTNLGECTRACPKGIPLNVISQMNPDATVAACGNAQGMDLPTNVAPFILRGVKLVGVNSVSTPMRRASRSTTGPSCSWTTVIGHRSVAQAERTRSDGWSSTEVATRGTRPS